MLPCGREYTEVPFARLSGNEELRDTARADAEAGRFRATDVRGEAAVREVTLRVVPRVAGAVRYALPAFFFNPSSSADKLRHWVR